MLERLRHLRRDERGISLLGAGPAPAGAFPRDIRLVQ